MRRMTRNLSSITSLWNIAWIEPEPVMSVCSTNKNYESVLEGEITETGVGLVLRKKLDKLSELFIFKKKK